MKPTITIDSGFHFLIRTALTAVLVLGPALSSEAAWGKSREGTDRPSVERKGLFQKIFSKEKDASSPSPQRSTSSWTRGGGSTATIASSPGASRTWGRASKSAKAGAASESLPENASVKQARLALCNGSNSRVIVDIGRQKAFLLVNNRIAVVSPVSTARPGKKTPQGTFTMSERVRSGKTSTIYHCVLPYWMRIGNSDCGFHAGHLPGYPASAGCVRLPADMARLIYDHTRVGTEVKICGSWNGI